MATVASSVLVLYASSLKDVFPSIAGIVALLVAVLGLVALIDLILSSLGIPVNHLLGI